MKRKTCRDELSSSDDSSDDSEAEEETIKIVKSKVITPSPEQQAVINCFLQGKNIQINAVAGSGKSSTVIFCCEQRKRSSLYLVYSKKLQIEAQEKIISKHLTHVQVRTYHGAVSAAYGMVINNDVKFIEALRTEPKNIYRLNCEVLYLDEFQDASIIYYLFIEKLIKFNPSVQIVIVGDRLQSINQFVESRAEFLTQCCELPGLASEFQKTEVQSTSDYLEKNKKCKILDLNISEKSEEIKVKTDDVDEIKVTTDDVKKIDEVKDVKDVKIDEIKDVKDVKIDEVKDVKEVKYLDIKRDEVKYDDVKTDEIKDVKQIKSIRHLRPWEQHILPVSYRLTPATAKFVNRHVLGENLLKGGNTTSPNLKPLYIAVPFGKMAYEIGKRVLDAIDKYGYDNVAILAPSIRSLQIPNSPHPLAVAIREHLAKIPLYMPKNDETIDEDLIKGKLVISSWNSFKGLERDCTILINFDETYFQYFCTDWLEPHHVPNIMYVAATRARKLLVIIADPSKTLRTIKIDTLNEDVRGIFKDKLKSIKPSKSNTIMKRRTITVPDLIRFIDSATMHKLMQFIKVVEEKETKCPKTSVALTIQFHTDSTDEKVATLSYYESVGFLYALVIPALVELDKTKKSHFGKNATVPQIVDSIEEIEPFSYCITQAAYDSFPKSYWDTVQAASFTKPKNRTAEQWFQLAVAETVFNENGHHIARQITNYDWINKDFLLEAKQCLLDTLQNNESSKEGKSLKGGEFEVKMSKRLGLYDLHGVVNYINKNEAWEFKCTHEPNLEHLLRLACYMALTDKSLGHLYLILSGKIVTIELTTPLKFLTTLLTKFDKKTIGNLVDDIEKFKKDNLLS